MLIRKCAVCGESIEVALPYSGKYVYKRNGSKSKGGKWYHLDCFESKVTSRTNINKYINNTSDFVLKEVSKDNIHQLFFKHYNMSCISARMFVKLDAIYDGTYKGLAQPIPPNELYDMLQRKMDYLDSNARKKGLDGESRANYDLAVVMASYGSYKAWLAKVKADQEEREAEMKKIKADPLRYKLWGHVQREERAAEEIHYNPDADDL